MIKLPSFLKHKYALLAGAVIVLTAVVVGAVIWRGNQPAKPGPTITHSTDKPSEEKVDEETYRWQGAADEPRYIELPSIGAGGFIQKVGVDQNKQIAVTTNIYFAGWFVDSAKPGKKGLSIIDGHVTGRQNDGIFKDLEKLQEGDEFTVAMGDGAVFRYKVTGLTTVDVADAANVLFSQDPMVRSQLNLITCGGEFDRATQQYKKRTIVTSALVN